MPIPAKWFGMPCVIFVQRMILLKLIHKNWLNCSCPRYAADTGR